MNKKLYPLFSAQKGMLFHSLCNDIQGMYITQVQISLNERMNIRFLQKAWDKVIERHEVLRGGIKGEIDKTELEIHAAINCQIKFMDITDCSHVKKMQLMSDFLLKDKIKNFNLSRVPLMRMTLLKLENDSYQLVWTHHHILLAGSSFAYILKEFFMLYDGYCQGHEILLPKPRSYKEYIELIKDADLCEEYWKNLFLDFYSPTKLSLSSDISEKKKQHTLQGGVSLSFSEPQTNKIKKHIENKEFTLNTLIQGAWALLLSIYSGCDDVVFGAVRAFPNSINDNFVGMFINTLPIRASFTKDTTVIEYLHLIRKQYKKIRECANTPLVKVKEWSGIPNSSDLFYTVIDYKVESLNAYLYRHIPKWKNRHADFSSKTNYPLVLEIYMENSVLCFRLNYHVDVCSRNMICNMLEHLKNIVLELITVPYAKVSEVNCLSNSELRKILFDWNKTKISYPEAKTISQLFEEQVNKTPNNIAVVFQDKELTYKQLNEKANQLAHYLRKKYKTRYGKALLPDTLVGIIIAPSLSMIVGILGILKAGAAYVSIDPKYPEERIKYMFKDSDVEFILTQGEILQRLSNLNAKEIICFDNASVLRKQSTKNLQTQSKANNLAYVIYTSGSTGRPKGVMLEHIGVCNLSQTNKKLFDLKAGCKVLQYASISFDASVYEIFPALLCGARLYVVDEVIKNNPKMLSKYIRQHKVNVAVLLPSILKDLVLQDMVTIKILVVAGEVCSAEIMRRWQNNRILINAYGPTENTVCASFCRYNENLSNINIGKPIQNVQIYVLNKDFQPLPINIPGELYIGGDGLARGYWNRPGLTKEKFIKNPFSKDKNSRLYKTGDLVRWLPDGNLEFIGRIDDQVKVRGFRIELGEIEAQLSKYDAISQAVVLAEKDDAGNNYLVGFLVPVDEDKFEVQGVRSHLQQFLPDYMVPDQFMVLDKLPITPNGKVDKKALLEVKASVVSKISVPSNEIEVNIASVLKKLLQRDVTDTNRNFFEMGVHSFLIIQASNLLCARLDTEIKPIDLFTYPTIKSLADFITQSKETESLETKPSVFDEALTKAKRKRQLVRKRKGTYGNI